jgi:hypothetical protein
VNCAVFCVKDDWKGHLWGLGYRLSKLRSLISFPSGMTSHSNVALFNWECIAPFRSKQRLLRALLSPLLECISGDVFVTTPTPVMGTDQFPKTGFFRQITTIKFSQAESRISMWRFCDVSVTNSVPIFRVCCWFGSTKTDSLGSTKPTAHPEDGDGVSSRIVEKPSHLDAAVCLRKLHWILSPRKVQDWHYDEVRWEWVTPRRTLIVVIKL